MFSFNNAKQLPQLYKTASEKNICAQTAFGGQNVGWGWMELRSMNKSQIGWAKNSHFHYAQIFQCEAVGFLLMRQDFDLFKPTIARHGSRYKT